MALNDAIFRHGDPVMVDYTPAAGAIAAGTVLLAGNTTGLTTVIAHLDIANNIQGAVAAGGGVYAVTNLNNAATFAKVWWDDSAKKVTTVSTNNALFGFVVQGGGLGANTVCRAIHKPYV